VQTIRIYLQGTNYDFSSVIPANALRLKGITVTIRRQLHCIHHLYNDNAGQVVKSLGQLPVLIFGGGSATNWPK
jgi:hypothetical protein